VAVSHTPDIAPPAIGQPTARTVSISISTFVFVVCRQLLTMSGYADDCTDSIDEVSLWQRLEKGFFNVVFNFLVAHAPQWAASPAQ
jgi:hypothetical protein